MTSLKIYLQQSHRCQEFFHNDISVWGISYARKCRKPLVQRYKAKHAETKLNKVDQNFWIFYFLCVFGFLTQKKKIDQKQLSKDN